MANTPEGMPTISSEMRFSYPTQSDGKPMANQCQSYDKPMAKQFKECSQLSIHSIQYFEAIICFAIIDVIRSLKYIISQQMCFERKAIDRVTETTGRDPESG